jgi:hypothetical protein
MHCLPTKSASAASSVAQLGHSSSELWTKAVLGLTGKPDKQAPRHR